MWEWLDETLRTFRGCFRRKAAYRWFVVAVLGLMIWREHTGVTSLIRELWIEPRHYDAMLHFFRSTAWELAVLQDHWVRIIKQMDVLFYEAAMPILVGDGVKQSKEAKHMPCVKRLFQESENSSKPSYIFGHMFGAIGVLIGTAEKLFCVPLTITIQDGDGCIRKWHNSDAKDESHVVRVIREASHAASLLMPSILLLDRYFLTAPALEAWLDEQRSAPKALLTIVTKAKSNAVAYEKPVRKPGRGRPPVRGASVKLSTLFKDCGHLFTQASVRMYGKTETVSYLCRDLLWGKGLYRELRFVLVKYGETQSILVCTNKAFTAEQIIRLYSYRFKIECCFRELKQVIAGFSYRFWSMAMPRLNRYNKSKADPLETITDKRDKRLIMSSFKAIQGFVMIACIAMGLLQICAFRFADVINASPVRWLRTKTNRVPSEATTADFLRKNIFRMFHLKPDLSIMQQIRGVQSPYTDSSGTVNLHVG